MLEWLDTQLSTSAIGIHSALQALTQVLEDVEARHVTISTATRESIGVSGDQVFLQAELIEVARGSGGGVYGDGQVEERTKVARSMIKVQEEVRRLAVIAQQLEDKWTQREGSEYKPSGMLAGVTSADGALAGAFVAVLGDGMGEMGKGDAEEEMWDALKELSSTEETLLKGWQEVVVDNEKDYQRRLVYNPPGTDTKTHFKKVNPAAMRYEPHPLEVRKHREGRMRAASRSAEIAERKKEDAKEAMSGKDEGGAGQQQSEEDLEIEKLKKLGNFRARKRQELVDTGVVNTKYSGLKVDSAEGTGFDSDEDSVNCNKDGADDDIFAKVDGEGAAARRKIKIAGLSGPVADGAKFPFRLNRFTIDSRMRPARLWNGGPQSCDMPPLVSGGEAAKEVSTVALVVPTSFVGGKHVCGGGNRLIKRADKDVWGDSPCLSRAAMASKGATKGAVKVPAGEKYVPRAHLPHEQGTPISDIDIRKYEDNWGPILMV